jgi:hypothetical protein
MVTAASARPTRSTPPTKVQCSIRAFRCSLFALCDVPEQVSDGQIGNVQLTATALTGSGAVGATFSGRGDEGVDAIVGHTAATAGAEAALVAELGRPELLKAQPYSILTGDNGPYPARS